MITYLQSHRHWLLHRYSLYVSASAPIVNTANHQSVPSIEVVCEHEQLFVEAGGKSFIRRHQQLPHHSDISGKQRWVIGFVSPAKQRLVYAGTGFRGGAVFNCHPFCSVLLMRAPRSPVPLTDQGKSGNLFIFLSAVSVEVYMFDAVYNKTECGKIVFL